MKTHILDFEAFELSSPDYSGIRNEIMGYVSSEQVAKDWVKEANSWPRGYRKVHIKHSYYVMDSLTEIEDVKKQKKLETALSKLTEEEKQLLTELYAKN